MDHTTIGVESDQKSNSRGKTTKIFSVRDRKQSNLKKNF